MAIGTPYSAAATVTSTATANSDTITTNANVPQGDTLFIFVSTRLATATTITSVTGGSGLSPEVYQFTSGGQNGDGGLVRIYAANAIASGTTFTLNYNQSPTRHELAAFGCSGVANATAPADHQGASNGSGGTVTATTGSGPSAGDLAIAMYNFVGSAAQTQTGTPSTGFTEYEDGPTVGASSPFLYQYVEYQLLTGGGAVTGAPTWSAGTTGGWMELIVVFSPGTSQIFTAMDEWNSIPEWMGGPWSRSPQGMVETVTFTTVQTTPPVVLPPKPTVITVAPSTPAVW